MHTKNANEKLNEGVIDLYRSKIPVHILFFYSEPLITQIKNSKVHMDNRLYSAES